ncbi:MAG: transposase [Candidatus Eisenbacteria bacterium RBG_16_71_46]|nr:MAG: transposase [Candidatus Eisenbacteria bacterium RBG_16_71_46]
MGGRTRPGKEACVKKKCVVTLSGEERAALQAMIASGKASARKLMHARILLKAERRDRHREWEDTRIAGALDVAVSTIEKVRQRLVEEGLEAALVPRPPRREYARKLDGKEEAHLIALACSTPPDGHGRWTLRLLADRMVRLDHVDSLSHETVR